MHIIQQLGGGLDKNKVHRGRVKQDISGNATFLQTNLKTSPGLLEKVITPRICIVIEYLFLTRTDIMYKQNAHMYIINYLFQYFPPLQGPTTPSPPTTPQPIVITDFGKVHIIFFITPILLFPHFISKIYLISTAQLKRHTLLHTITYEIKKSWMIITA